MSLHIRDARASDRKAIKEVTLSAYQEYATVMPPAHWQEYRKNIVDTLADIESAEQIVAEENGEILGTVLLYPQTKTKEPNGKTKIEVPYIRLLAVVPSARGRGIGQALMQECIRRAHQSGAKVIELHTTDMMQAAMRLYERMGFKRLSKRDFNPAPGVAIKAYQLKLDQEYIQTCPRI